MSNAPRTWTYFEEFFKSFGYSHEHIYLIEVDGDGNCLYKSVNEHIVLPQPETKVGPFEFTNDDAFNSSGVQTHLTNINTQRNKPNKIFCM